MVCMLVDINLPSVLPVSVICVQASPKAGRVKAEPYSQVRLQGSSLVLGVSTRAHSLQFLLVRLLDF
jgi:hypothetical protein